MIKTFCDGCGELLGRNYVSKRLQRNLKLNGRQFTVDTLVATDGIYNDGDLCLKCLLKVINEGTENDRRI